MDIPTILFWFLFFNSLWPFPIVFEQWPLTLESPVTLQHSGSELIWEGIFRVIRFRVILSLYSFEKSWPLDLLCRLHAANIFSPWEILSPSLRNFSMKLQSRNVRRRFLDSIWSFPLNRQVCVLCGADHVGGGCREQGNREAQELWEESWSWGGKQSLPVTVISLWASHIW